MIKQNGFIIFRKFYCFYKIYVFDKQNLSSNNKTFVSKITKFHFPKNKTKFIIGNKRISRVYISVVVGGGGGAGRGGGGVG